MQVDPTKLTLKAPGTKRLTLEYHQLLSSFGFGFNLSHYRALAVADARGAVPAASASPHVQRHAVPPIPVGVDFTPDIGSGAHGASSRSSRLSHGAAGTPASWQLERSKPRPK